MIVSSDLSGFLILQTIKYNKSGNMKDADLIEDAAYRLRYEVEGYRQGTIVVFKWMSENRKLAIVIPNGESNMRHMFGISPAELDDVE